MDSLFRIVGRLVATSVIVPIWVLVGCDAPADSFEPNELYAQVVAIRQETERGEAARDVRDLVETLFGTPDEPKLPAAIPAGLLDADNLTRAAGPVSSDQQDVHFGLFRKHCVVCHGLDGSGAGPAAALQNPYPRDFRPGIFKFKSTARSDKPTKDDLRAILRRGAPGSSMPSFARMRQEDLDAVIDYVIYLSIRGEVQRRLIQYAIMELGYGDEDFPDDEPLERIAGLDSETIAQMIQQVAQPWVDPQPIEVPPLASAIDPDAVERGRELFHGPLANCSSCHGREGRGNALTLDFDDWTKEYTTLLGISPRDTTAVGAMRKLGALPPRPSSPTKLSWGVYRGSDDPESLYRRLVAGIAGTPMPGLLVQSGEGTAGLAPDQVWDLVAYLRWIAEPSLAGASR